MSRTRYVAYRLAWTVVGAWSALTAIFLTYALTPDPGQYMLGGGTDAYRAARNYDRPLLDRYLTWMESFATLDLGTTVSGKPIADVLGEATAVTLTYLVPAVVLAVVVGVAAGTFVAMRPESRLLRLLKAGSYVGFAVPTFLAADVLFIVAERAGWYAAEYDLQQGPFTSRNLGALLLPAVVLAVNLLAVQLRYARSESVEILQEGFVKTLRATGAGTVTFARHVFRNAASSLLSLFFSELVGVIFVVAVVVEVVFGVPGYGTLLFDAIQDRDGGVILAATVFPILLVMVGNLLQDVAYAVLDPRVESE
jgi:peptide/nickel transport system permease protein